MDVIEKCYPEGSAESCCNTLVDEQLCASPVYKIYPEIATQQLTGAVNPPKNGGSSI